MMIMTFIIDFLLEGDLYLLLMVSSTALAPKL